MSRLITNAALYSAIPITGWLEVDDLDLGGGKTAFYLPSGQTTTVASVRANGIVIEVNNIAGNETFTINGQFAKATIGEGPRVLGLA